MVQNRNNINFLVNFKQFSSHRKGEEKINIFYIQNNLGWYKTSLAGTKLVGPLKTGFTFLIKKEKKEENTGKLVVSKFNVIF